MKTLITKQHTDAMAVQPLTTFPKEDRMKKQSFNTLKLAIVFAMVVTMTLSAAAQNYTKVALNWWFIANNAVTFTSFYDSAGGLHGLSQPNDMVFDGQNMWISEASANRVTKIRAMDGQFQASYTVTSPGSLAFDGERLWVNHPDGSGHNLVSVLFASDGKSAFADQSTAQNSPGKAMIWDGWTMWEVADSTVGRILSWSGGGYYCSVTTGGGNTGVAFDGTFTWVSNSSGSVVYKFDYRCQQQTFSVPGNPVGIVFDGGTLWTANADGTVSHINLNGALIHPPYPVGGSPRHIAFDGANIWITYSSGTTKKIPTSGSAIGTVISAVSGCGTGAVPVGLAFDGASMWDTCPGSNQVGKM